jgi:hypothetical protein
MKCGWNKSEKHGSEPRNAKALLLASSRAVVVSIVGAAAKAACPEAVIILAIISGVTAPLEVALVVEPD